MSATSVPPPPNYPPTVPAAPAAPAGRRAAPRRTRKAIPRRTPRRGATLHIDQHPRLRAVLYNAAAAGAGWWCGLGPWMFQGITHYGQAHDVQRGVWVGAGLALVSLAVEARTHAWRRPDRPVLTRAAGWAGRIPLATALTALALYGPDATL
ncbi:hypothetical protein [Streptomyces cyaneofuscatus]|uniref:hypothetical protein n=1 Tax=Streptomyces cyaneofuscatus TaxID=66883 RepID=UPI0013D8F54D|nr:hypothetical protein [Streptomyces cyaneofuscatus]NDZ63582.1 hypothetical protein [Streptomyces cyaneofuscatus]